LAVNLAQEFIIKSNEIEDKINQLLPSQGGKQAGVDFSASTMVIPVVDLTETAEGSSLRQDLQTSLSLNTATAFSVNNTTTTLVNTTGYYRVIGTLYILSGASSNVIGTLTITDGTTTKNIFGAEMEQISGQDGNVINYDFNVKLEAGDSLQAISSSTNARFIGSTRQIADLSGNLINP